MVTPLGAAMSEARAEAFSLPAMESVGVRVRLGLVSRQKCNLNSGTRVNGLRVTYCMHQLTKERERQQPVRRFMRPGERGGFCAFRAPRCRLLTSTRVISWWRAAAMVWKESLFGCFSDIPTCTASHSFPVAACLSL